MSQMYDQNSTRWCGSVNDLTSLVEKSIDGKVRTDRFWLYCINLYSLGLLEKNLSFLKAVSSRSSIAVADGVIVTLLAYLKGTPARQRITGYDVFDTILRTRTKNQLRCFFFGSDVATLDAIQARLERDYRDVTCVGVISPPVSKDGLNDEDDEFVKMINNARPDVLFIGLTQPKQEVWIDKHFDSLDVPVAACIGAVFDFFAGNKTRAPAILRSLGLEWIVRIIEDPKKISKRFIYALPVVIRSLFRGMSQ